MKNPEYAQDVFGTNRWLLQMAGLWTPDCSSGYLRIIYKFYAIFVFIFVNIYFTTTEFLSLFTTRKDIYTFIKNINFALTHLMGAVKVIFWYFYGDEFKRLLIVLEKDEFHYEESPPEFQPGKITQIYKKFGQKYTRIFFFMAISTLSSSYIPPLISTIFTNNPAVLDQPLPYYSWMPFRYDTRWWYLIAMAYQAGPMFSYAFSIVGMDTLFMSVMNYIGGHFAILQQAFKTIGTRNRMGTINEEMIKTCRHLQVVLDVCEKLENLYKYVTLGQAMASLFILCTSLYLVSTTPTGSKQFIAEIIYMMAMGFQLVLYCYFGNEVTLQAKDMPLSIFQSDWIDCDGKFKQIMCFTMTRMQKPIYFTVGKFVPLTLQTFLAIVKASYSFFAVIKNRKNSD